jgi:HD superfamily phosphohydrolase YqeK
MDAQRYERAEAVVAHALSEAQRRHLRGVASLAAQLIEAQWAVNRQDAAHASYERYVAAFTDADDRALLRAAAPWLRAS